MCIHTYIHTTYMYAYINIYIYIHTYIHTYIHAYIHTYLHESYFRLSLLECMCIYIHYTIQAVKPHFTAQSLNCIARIIYHLLPSKIDPSDPHLDGRLLKYYDILSQQLYPVIYTIYEGTTNSDTGDFCGAALQSLFHKNKPNVIQRFIDMGFPLMLLQKLKQRSSLIFYKFKSHVTDTLSECYEYSTNCQKVILRQLLKDPICQIHEMKEQCIRGTYFNIYYDVIDKLRNQMITTESVCITAVSIPVVSSSSSSKSSTIPTITSNNYLSSSSSKKHYLSVSSCSKNYQQSTSSSSPPSSSSIDLYNNLSSLQASRTNKSRFPKSLTTTTTATTSTTTSSTATIVTRLASSIKSRTSSSMLIENNSADSVRQVVNNVRFISLKSSKSSSSQSKSSSSSQSKSSSSSSQSKSSSPSQSKTSSSSSSLHSKRNNEVVAAIKDKAISSKYSNNNYSTEELNTTKDNDTSVDQVDDTQSNYHSSPVEVESPLLKDMWTCAHCLFDNITSEDVCSICMT